MSYDASIIYPPCACCGRSADSTEIGNMTSNVGAMYRVVLPGPYEGGGRYDGVGTVDPQRSGLPGLSGLLCTVAAPLMRAALAEMKAREDEMLALEPANGWGNYGGAFNYLTECAEACEANPGGVFAVNW